MNQLTDKLTTKQFPGRLTITPRRRMVLEKLIFSSAFYGTTEGSLPCSQQPVTELYSQTVGFSTHTHALFLQDSF
jgi:hypothetical protein